MAAFKTREVVVTVETTYDEPVFLANEYGGKLFADKLVATVFMYDDEPDIQIDATASGFLPKADGTPGKRKDRLAALQKSDLNEHADAVIAAARARLSSTQRRWRQSR